LRRTLADDGGASGRRRYPSLSLSVDWRRILFFAARHYSKRLVREWSLQAKRIGRFGIEPKIELVRGHQDHRHRLGIDRGNDGVRRGRHKPEQFVLALDRSARFPEMMEGCPSSRWPRGIDRGSAPALSFPKKDYIFG
jgi:hypothetical protein